MSRGCRAMSGRTTKLSVMLHYTTVNTYDDINGGEEEEDTSPGQLDDHVRGSHRNGKVPEPLGSSSSHETVMTGSWGISTC